MIFSTWQITLL